MKRALWSVLVASVGLVSVPARPARADLTKDQCVEANTSAQRLRLAGKLGAARAELRLCADPSCPAIVRDDCTLRIDEVGVAQPTIVFDVKDATGGDVADAKVTMDGAVLPGRLDGTARMVDPGEHVFTFEVAGSLPVKRTFVIKEGEKQRRERIVVAVASAASPVAPSSSPGLGTQRIAGIALGGAGIAGVAVGAVFGALAASAWSKQQADCGSSPCSATGHQSALNDHTTLTTDGAVSTAAFIVGGALLAGGTVLFLTAPRRAPSGTGFQVSPGLGPHEATLGLRGTF